MEVRVNDGGGRKKNVQETKKKKTGEIEEEAISQTVRIAVAGRAFYN